MRWAGNAEKWGEAECIYDIAEKTRKKETTGTTKM
jgi:hypothetical protein